MRRVPVVAAVAVAQLACVGAAVAPQLSSRVTGEDYLMTVRPVDPIDPFRGAYVTLDYPDLRPPDGGRAPRPDGGRRGTVYVPLVEEDGRWVATDWQATRPEQGPYLACEDTAWATRCGIESFFVPQARSGELQEQLSTEGGVATVRIDDAGHATVIDVR